MTMMSTHPVTSLEMEFGDATSFSDWIRLVSNRFVPLRLSADQEQPFTGSIRSRYIDEIVVSDITASAHSVERLASDISLSDSKHFKLTLQVEGTGVVAQGDHRAVLREGDAAIYDTSCPYTLDYTESMRALVMVFPHDTLGFSESLIRKLAAVRLSGDSGIGRVISPFMRHIAEDLEHLSGTHGVRIVRSAVDLIAALLSAEHLENEPADDAARATLESVRLYIEANLDDPELSASKVAKAHFVSLRYLQYLFSQEGLTLSSYIRTRRLERCRLDLHETSVTGSILQIAQRWGFTDASHFSRIFKAAYSVSPREYRARLDSGIAHEKVS